MAVSFLIASCSGWNNNATPASGYDYSYGSWASTDNTITKTDNNTAQTSEKDIVELSTASETTSVSEKVNPTIPKENVDEKEVSNIPPPLSEKATLTEESNQRNDHYNLDNASSKKAEEVTGIKPIPEFDTNNIKKSSGATIKVIEPSDAELSSDYPS